jgi:hypothetical protein
VDLDHRAAENLAKMVAWAEDSLEYAREHGQRRLGRLLEAVRIEVRLENALFALPTGGHLGPEQASAQEESAQKNEQAAAKAREALGRKRDEERRRARLAEWELFMQAELRELDLRKDGQLARLLGDPMPGEPSEALRRLANEDQRQAEEGLVALMCNGKVSYKHVSELGPEDRPARIAANRARAAWLKERRDVWLPGGGPGISTAASLFASSEKDRKASLARARPHKRGEKRRTL